MQKKPNYNLRKYFFIVIALTTSSQCLSIKYKPFLNEKAIVFKTMDNQTTDAFQGYIEVPENRNKRNSRLIKINYVRFPATTHKKSPPIIYLAGGPGGSGINTAKYPNFRYPLFMALRDYGDVIALDQRGTGASNDLPLCTSSQALSLTTKEEENTVISTYKKAVNECVDFWQQNNIDILGYNTRQSALDIDDLRKHLQADKVILWGISYGSHLAFSAMKEMKNKIDKVIIASAEGLNQTVKLPAQTDEYFVRLQQAINTQAEAKKVYPDIVELMRRVHKKLTLKPIKVNIPQPNGTEIEMLFQKSHLQRISSFMITDPHRGVKQLLRLYNSLDHGNNDVLLAVLKRGYFDHHAIYFDAMPLAMDIASGITDERLALVNEQAKSSLLGLALNFPMPHLNKSIKHLDLGDDFRTPPENNIPTLLFSGTLDGRTYIKSQKQATQGLSNLTHVIIENAGHNLFMSSPEVTEIIKTFLKGEKVTKKKITVDLPLFFYLE